MCVQLGVLFPLVLAQSYQVCSWQGGWQGATSPFKCVFGFPVLAAELLGLSTILLSSVGLQYIFPPGSSSASISLPPRVDTYAFCSFFFHFSIPGSCQLSSLAAAPGLEFSVICLPLCSLPPLSRSSPGAALCIRWLKLGGLYS